jgi:hypothetical protein
MKKLLACLVLLFSISGVFAYCTKSCKYIAGFGNPTSDKNFTQGGQEGWKECQYRKNLSYTCTYSANCKINMGMQNCPTNL